MKAAAARAKILADLDRFRHLFDLDKDDLGKRLCKAATDGVQYTLADEKAPDGTRWDDLSPNYAAWKAFNFPGNPTGLLHGVMENPREVAGEVEVDSEHAKVTYGVTEQARREAQWFQEGNAHQPPRPFWGLTESALIEIKQILDDHFEKA